jgi:hypothetical protein
VVLRNGKKPNGIPVYSSRFLLVGISIDVSSVGFSVLVINDIPGVVEVVSFELIVELVLASAKTVATTAGFTEVLRKGKKPNGIPVYSFRFLLVGISMDVSSVCLSVLFVHEISGVVVVIVVLVVSFGLIVSAKIVATTTGFRVVLRKGKKPNGTPVKSLRFLLVGVSVDVSSVCRSVTVVDGASGVVLVVDDSVVGGVVVLVTNLLVLSTVVGKAVFLILKTPCSHGSTSVLRPLGLPRSLVTGATVVLIQVEVLPDQSGGKNSPPNSLGSPSVVVALGMNSSLKVAGGAQEVSSVKTGLPPHFPSVVSSPNCLLVLENSGTTVTGATVLSPVEESIVNDGMLPLVPEVDSSPPEIRVLAKSASGNGVETVLFDRSLISTVVVMFSGTGQLLAG